MLAEKRKQRADYMRRWRRMNADAREDEKAAQRARERALVRLSKLHPRQLRRLVDEERSTEGLPPLGTMPVGRPRSTNKNGPAAGGSDSERQAAPTTAA